MIGFPQAKINLGLNILARRPDGFHELETVLFPIPLSDALELRKSEELSFNVTGLDIPGNSANNLCLKAYELLKEKFGLPPVDIHLHKVIPMGAGLGGGSSDGSTMLKLLNAEFSLGLSDNELEELSATLGSDCPFFIQGKPCIGTGTGTELNPLELDLSGYKLLLILPPVHSSTAEAYGGVHPIEPEERISEIISDDPATWKGRLMNDFEESIFERYPELASIKSWLYESGAVYASMSGSGAAMFGLFSERMEISPGDEHYWFSL